jgi:hypothetical protein
MANRALTLEEKRILATREASLKSVAGSFKEAIDRDKRPAPAGMREDAFSGMWNFSRIRNRIPDEVRALERYIHDQRPGSQDEGLNLRLMRIALALYFLDKMDEFSEAVRAKGGMQLTSLFSVARSRVERILDGGYFSKTPRQILTDYLDAQCALTSLSAATSVPVHAPGDAVAMYHMKVCDMIGEAEASRTSEAG